MRQRHEVVFVLSEAMKIILNKSKPENINCDQGSEFMSKEFKKLMSNNKI